jgi:hypothetical protein
MDKNKKQGQSNPDKGNAGPKQGKHERKNDPVASQRPDPKNQRSQESQQDQDRAKGNTGEAPSGEWKRPLTNHDEQRKPTNAGNSGEPMGEEETEGDPGQERIKPYKNIGDDSEEVEKKTPSMG